MVKLSYLCRLSSLPGMPTSLLHWPGEHILCCTTSPIRPYGPPLQRFHPLYSIQVCLVISIAFSGFIVSSPDFLD